MTRAKEARRFDQVEESDVLNKTSVHVAVGVIYDAQGRILIARRPDHVAQGGLWEFPGGKVDEPETVITALQRELHEELGIEIKETQPLIQIHHDYGDKQVWLDIHEVLTFHGEPHGREGQPIRWVSKESLSDYAFPAANLPIVHAVQLPPCYVITGAFSSSEELLTKTQQVFAQGHRLIQFGAKALPPMEYVAFAEQLRRVCHLSQARLILNAAAEVLHHVNADGIHLSSQRLLALSQRPISKDKWLFASVHNEQELQHAQRIGVDVVVIAPVAHTTTHPDVMPLGWPGLEKMARRANCPVYALGGLSKKDVVTARQHGAQGVAAISAFWPK